MIKLPSSISSLLVSYPLRRVGPGVPVVLPWGAAYPGGTGRSHTGYRLRPPPRDQYPLRQSRYLLRSTRLLRVPPVPPVPRAVEPYPPLGSGIKSFR